MSTTKFFTNHSRNTLVNKFEGIIGLRICLIETNFKDITNNNAYMHIPVKVSHPII
jgi:hypothetical protein